MLDEFHSPLLSNETWRLSMIAYRKWEQRRDRTTNPEMRQRFGKELARTYLALSNVARQIVTDASGKKGSHRYNLKRVDTDPNRIWFQRNEHEPWLDLGYFDHMLLRWYDTEEQYRNAKRTPTAFTPSEGANLHRLLSGSGHTDHVHFALSPNIATPDTEGIDMNGDSPEALEAAAAHAMARAAELRAIDNKEPNDTEEPTLSWAHEFEIGPDIVYPFVAFKSTDDRWYVTGTRAPRHGMTWRELYGADFAAALRNEGKHADSAVIVTEWSRFGGGE